LPGVYDKAYKTVDNGLSQNGGLMPGDFVKLNDVRDIIHEDTRPNHLAENFAIGELLLDRVTTTLVLTLPAMTKLNNGDGTTFNMGHDQHRIGALVGTIGTTLMYRAFLGCLSEFSADLKRRGLFDSTIMHISAEFNRSPRITSDGADHAPYAANTTLISGMIKQPACIGNIQKAGLDATYVGTFGIAKPYVLDDFNRPIQVNDVARTITTMLGVDDIVTNGRSLLKSSGGKWVVKKDEANNV
jgi:hypothetical protein